MVFSFFVLKFANVKRKYGIYMDPIYGRQHLLHCMTGGTLYIGTHIRTAEK